MKGAVNMFCKNCGYQNADDAKRCSKCGSPLYSFQNKMSSNYNNASNVNQVNQGQMYYSSTPVAQRKSKLPIIIVASILAVVLFVGGIFGFLFISSKNSVAIPEWSDTITVMFNDVKKEGKFETAINKHSFENQFKDMSSDQRMVLSVLDALIKDMSFRCSNYKDVFYKTDHHWKSQFGLYGARAIANYLNKEFGYNIDADLLSEQEFNFINHEKIWFGETGRSMSITWVRALDDFMEITPSYKTSFTGDDFSNPEKLKENGDFSILYNPSGYAGNNDLYSYSAHYSYGKYAGYGAHIHNNLIKNGKKIMIVKDSFSVVVIPFLACAASDVFVWDMRDTDDSIYDYISKNKIDAVIVAYTDFWKSKMYDFQ